ncbi:MAG: precorrin-8X methylmutase, partial [Pseudomonadota bacterium]
MTGPLFDTHVTLDWSSSTTPSPARPRKDAIWWGVARIGRAGVRVEPPRYVRTRAAAVAALKAFLTAELRAGRRVLLGADFPFGYPAGFAAHLTGSASALAVWDWLRQAITDGADNANNRFEVAAEINARFDGVGPFWGRPAARHLPDLPAQGRARWGSDHPPERRLVEQHQRSAQPVWKLYTTGSVGGQTLMGLPALAGLREHFAGQMQVWPFETGLARPTTPLVLAEIYPSLLKPDPEPIKDAGQVRATSRAFAALDAAGGLAPLFDAVPDLSTAERKVVATEEAWILGVGHQAALKEALASTTALPDTPPAEPSATPRPAPAKVAPDDRPRRADRRKPAAPDHATPRPAERPHPAPRAYDYLRDPQEIYAKSFAIVRAETDLGDVPADLAPLIIRLVHACGMPEIVDDLVWSQDVAASGHAALAAGAPILCDCEMVARGVIR